MRKHTTTCPGMAKPSFTCFLMHQECSLLVTWSCPSHWIHCMSSLPLWLWPAMVDVLSAKVVLKNYQRLLPVPNMKAVQFNLKVATLPFDNGFSLPPSPPFSLPLVGSPCSLTFPDFLLCCLISPPLSFSFPCAILIFSVTLLSPHPAKAYKLAPLFILPQMARMGFVSFFQHDVPSSNYGVLFTHLDMACPLKCYRVLRSFFTWRFHPNLWSLCPLVWAWLSNLKHFSPWAHLVVLYSWIPIVLTQEV